MNSSVGSRFTFEKCIFEAYMAFRGIGGKKPDEGRGRWAQSHLKQQDDPTPLATLADKFHNGDTSRASFWINQILEAEVGIDGLEEMTRSYGAEELEKALQHLEGLRALSQQRTSYENLCNEFCQMLEDCRIVILPYPIVFGEYRGDLESIGSDGGPARLDRFVRDTIIPSEDLEIVYAALRVAADIFVTDDLNLRRCAMSLGLNFALAPTAFCSIDEYSKRMQDYLEYGQ